MFRRCYHCGTGPTLFRMKVKNLFYLLAFSLLSCSKKTEPAATTPENTITSWIADASFEKINIAGERAVKDIAFNEGNAAYLDDLNRIFFSYTNGTEWKEKLNMSGNTIQSIALRADGEKLFLGGISLGNYTYGAKFWVYNTPKNTSATLDYNGEALIANLNEPIQCDFMRTTWNGDGSVYASFGTSTMKDGFFGNIRPDGRKIFNQRTPSHTFVMGKNPSFQKNHCAGFYIAGNNESTTLCVYEYVPSANMNILTPYYSDQKGHNNSWLPLASYWKAGLVYHIGQDKTGAHAIYVSQANRLFYNGQEEIAFKGIQGNLQCASIDNNNFVWVGTSAGLFKSIKPLL